MPHMRPMTLATRISNTLKQLGITQAEGARRCHMSPQRFGNYASGKRTPDIETLILLSKALNTTPNELLGIDFPGSDLNADIIKRLLQLEGLSLQQSDRIAQTLIAAQNLYTKILHQGSNLDLAEIVAIAAWSAAEPDQSCRSNNPI